MLILHTFLNILLIFSGCLVFLAENPVHSVLFLIMTFCSSSIIMFLFHVEFLGLAFIVIYVGAVAVLFLFVVMMLNTKISLEKNYLIVTIFVLTGILILIETFLLLKDFFFNYDFVCTENNLFNANIVLDSLNNIEVLGQSLYNYFSICFLICGLVLLVAMLGAIVLTLQFGSQRKNELTFRQISKTSNFINHII